MPIRPRITNLTDCRPLQRGDLVRHFEALFAESGDALNLFALRDGCVLAQNEACFTILGYTREEFESRPIESFYPEDELAKVASAFQRMAAAGFVAEYVQMYHRDGTLRDLWIRSYIVQREPEPICLVHTIDVTEEKRREAAALQRARLATLGEFVTTLVHELGNALLSLEDSATFLREERHRLSPEGVANLDRVHGAAQHMMRVFKNVQQSAGNGAAVGRAMSMPAALRGVVSLIHAYLRQHHIELVCDAPATTPLVAADSVQLQQILLILIKNAVQAMAGGTTRRLRLGVMRKSGEVEIEVSDTGVGIAPEIAARLFQPFASSKPAGVGLGLGLCIAQRLADANQIRLAFTSSPESGTSFRITARLARPLADAPYDAVLSGRVVLLVDALAGSGSPAFAALTGLGLIVLVAQTGDEALDLVDCQRLDAVVVGDNVFPSQPRSLAQDLLKRFEGPVFLGALETETVGLVDAAATADQLPEPAAFALAAVFRPAPASAPARPTRPLAGGAPRVDL